MKKNRNAAFTSFAAGAVLLASFSGTADAVIVYQDFFGNDGVATNTGIGGGLNEYQRQGAPWEDNGNLISNTVGNNDRGNVTSANAFNLAPGFRLTVSYSTVDINNSVDTLNRALFGLLDTNSLPATQNNTNYVTDYLGRGTVQNYGIGMNLSPTDNTQGFNFNNGAGTLTQLSNAQAITNGSHTVVMSVDASGNWSYSIDGATATTGITTFDLDRNYHFHSFAQGNEHGLVINSVTLETIPEPTSFALVGFGLLGLLGRRRR